MLVAAFPVEQPWESRLRQHRRHRQDLTVATLKTSFGARESSAAARIGLRPRPICPLRSSLVRPVLTPHTSKKRTRLKTRGSVAFNSVADPLFSHLHLLKTDSRR